MKVCVYIMKRDCATLITWVHEVIYQSCSSTYFESAGKLHQSLEFSFSYLMRSTANYMLELNLLAVFVYVQMRLCMVNRRDNKCPLSFEGSSARVPCLGTGSVANIMRN